MEPTIRRPLIADATFSRLMDALTGGAVLAGIALLTGASNLWIAVIAAVPFLAQVIQLPAIAILLRVQDRRRMVLWTAATARIVLLVVAGLIWAAPGWLTTGRLTALLLVASVLTVFATAAWNWWMRDLLPSNELGAFFAQRLRYATFASVAAMLLAGGLLDYFQHQGDVRTAYAVLFSAGGIAGLLGVLALARTPHVNAPPSSLASHALRRLSAAIRQAPRGVIAVLALTTATASFAIPFTAIYLLRGLGYSFLAVTALAVASHIAYVVGLNAWSQVSDRHGDRALVGISLSLLGLASLGWALAGWNPGNSLLVFLAILHLLSGYAMGALELATTNLLLRSAPKHEAAGYMAGLGLLRATAGFASVLVAGVLWEALGPGVLGQWTVASSTWTLRGFQLLNVVALLLLAATAAALARMEASPGTRVADVARALRREAPQMSSIAGLRGLIHAVSYYVEFMAAPFAARRR